MNQAVITGDVIHSTSLSVDERITLSKHIQTALKKKLVTSKVQKIYIALDKDAIKQALSFCEELLNEGKEVYLVDMDDKDPSEMGFEKFTHLIQNTFPLTFSDLFEKKLQLV